MGRMGYVSSASKWAHTHFGEALCTDIRRQRRLVDLASKMMKSPGKSIPALCGSIYDTKATYNLLAHRESNPDYLQKGHRLLVQKRIKDPGTYLFIEDDTTLSWSGKEEIPGLGPVGDFREGRQGFQIHSTLVVKWPSSFSKEEKRPGLEVIGLADQQYFLRSKAPASKERRKRSLATETRARESDVWFHSTDRIGANVNESECKRIKVCDRAADIYELFLHSKEAGYDYVVRALQDRGLVTEDSTKTRLFESARQQPSLGQFDLRLRSRPGKAARSVQLSVSAKSIKIRSPQRGRVLVGQLAPVECTIVHVQEIGGSQVAESEKIEWFLLTSQPVNSFDDAYTIVQQYASRWIIEDFHKALKSGCGAERLQLKHGQRLIAAVALMSIIATRVIDLRESARHCPDADAESTSLSKFELEVLASYTQRTLITVYEAALAVASLGGHLNRKGDGPPGLLTLTRGMEKLQTLCEGARIKIS